TAFDSGSTNILWKYTYISGDGTGSGGKFENRSENLTQSEVNFVSYVRVKPDDENVVFIGGLNIIRSDDGFATADQMTNMQNANYDLHPDQNAMVFFPSNPEPMALSTDGGVRINQ